MTAPPVPRPPLPDSLRLLSAIVDDVRTPDCCRLVAAEVADLGKQEEARSKARTPLVRALGAARIHLERAARGIVPVDLARKLAGRALRDAVEAAGGGS